MYLHFVGARLVVIGVMLGTGAVDLYVLCAFCACCCFSARFTVLVTAFGAGAVCLLLFRARLTVLSRFLLVRG